MFWQNVLGCTVPEKQGTKEKSNGTDEVLFNLLFLNKDKETTLTSQDIYSVNYH